MSDAMTLPGTDVAPEAVAAGWLADFEAALAGCRVDDAVGLFVEGGWWRDMLALTWDLRTLHGAEHLRSVLEQRLQQVRFAGLSLEGSSAAVLEAGGSTTMVQAFFDFATAVGRGRGIVRLAPAGEEWKGFTLFTSLTELAGHQQAIGRNRRKGVEHGPRDDREIWKERRRRERAFVDAEPKALIIGAGQGGLSLAARLGALDVAALVVERNERVGDNWRSRYPGLVLHDPVWYDHLPYMPFPASWPIFTAKDKLADWLEAYADAMDLNVWTSTELVAASYDDDGATWTVTVRRADGRERTLHPHHVILATGASSDPHVPDIPGREQFAGEVTHSSSHRGGAAWSGGTAVVVGAGNSGLDVAQDFHEHGVDVTVVQRSGTYVVSSEHGIATLFGGVYDEDGPPTDDADMLFCSTPVPLLAAQLKDATDMLKELDAEMLAGLERRGFTVDFGEDGSGLFMKYMRRAGGYYIDVGCAALIASGDVKVKRGGVRRFTATGLELEDGSTVDADVVVMATGYKNMRETAGRLLGDEVAERCGPVWGLDDEGELRGVWRPSGHPGLWFMAGNLALARFFSLRLALQLAAREAGLAEAQASPS